MTGLAGVVSPGGSPLPPPGEAGDIVRLPAFPWAIRADDEGGFHEFGYVTFDRALYPLVVTGTWRPQSLTGAYSQGGALPAAPTGAGWWYLTGTGAHDWTWTQVGSAAPAAHTTLYALDVVEIEGTFNGSTWSIGASLPTAPAIARRSLWRRLLGR